MYILCQAQVVTDEQWAARADRFPEEAPKTREYYLLRAIFQKHFPSKSAYNTVPRVSISCDRTVRCGAQC
jgi:asparagine synthase (glutamine-hydrolysing)